MAGRRVCSSHEFDRQVEELGGYEKFDDILAPIIDGLYYNPYGYCIAQNDWVKLCRYARTIPQHERPAISCCL